MAKLARAVMLCTTPECREWKQGRFMLASQFLEVERYCACCGGPVDFVPDTFDYTGGQPYRQVRVEYDYDCIEHRYRAIAIVTNEDSEGIGVHTYRTAVVKTEKRALQIAESRLSNLCAGQDAAQYSLIIDFADSLEEIKRVCAAMTSG